jgi:hypothetical protein
MRVTHSVIRKIGTCAGSIYGRLCLLLAFPLSWCPAKRRQQLKRQQITPAALNSYGTELLVKHFSTKEVKGSCAVNDDLLFMPP